MLIFDLFLAFDLVEVSCPPFNAVHVAMGYSMGDDARPLASVLRPSLPRSKEDTSLAHCGPANIHQEPAVP